MAKLVLTLSQDEQIALADGWIQGGRIGFFRNTPRPALSSETVQWTGPAAMAAVLVLNAGVRTIPEYSENGTRVNVGNIFVNHARLSVGFRASMEASICASSAIT